MSRFWDKRTGRTAAAGLGPPLVSRCLRGRGTRLGLGLACLGQGCPVGGAPLCCLFARWARCAWGSWASGGGCRRGGSESRSHVEAPCVEWAGQERLQAALRHAPKAIAARTHADTRRHTRQAHATTFSTTGSRNVQCMSHRPRPHVHRRSETAPDSPRDLDSPNQHCPKY